MREITIHTPFIALNELLKLAGVVGSGAEAKLLIRSGEVWVNGESCTVVRKKITVNDRVDVPDQGSFTVVSEA
ncbi:ribosome-associated protein [Negativicoccus succinicivorans]|mgnify:FL=1|uniref:Ribosome-associated protein n=1 Tax=Negativicoccus succinicivorans TaxID=620903 RepID=A0A841QYX5_9FIRM|nr:RNA-binding S4 domain-containing protein [Negativicoccus succinicivorans]MBB6477824.1 ribosome-associated protein [Negativicoccus succinicivorans]MDU2095891.1 RNA-binding S4 domain-containing protein [Negativicoccus succinicivorans]MDU2930062.1 RNA-binding S4 domain-containing protein [Negativicoccus succinicivorans]MDU5529533.1 RNA-binding S4 domain-containing protein [Negativicoccus succinicivorans]